MGNYENRCVVCEEAFSARIPHKKTCSKECRKKHQITLLKKRSGSDKFVEIKCYACDTLFMPKRKAHTYCSKKCKKHAEYLRLKPLMAKGCIQCGKGFETRKEATKYCSQACVNHTMANPPVTKNCEWCNEEFTVPFIIRRRRFCSKSCSTSHMNENRDEAVSKRVGRRLKEAYASGRLIHPFKGRKHTQKTKDKISRYHIENGTSKGKNNPMYGKKHTAKTKEKISKTRAERIINGDYASWFHKGTHFSKKLNKGVVFRSSWEERAFKSLDVNDNVIDYAPEPFSLEYHYVQKRNYIPDILVTYKDGTQKLIEIKPEYFVGDKKNQAKFKAAKKFCKERNIIFEVWTEKTIRGLTT